jgi:hypothetical protein
MFGTKIFDFEPQISSWVDKPDNHFGTKKIQDVGQSFWEGGSRNQGFHPHPQ